jgi:hypothetical protein
MSMRPLEGTPIETHIDGAWQPLEFANETPVYP